tara:strand:+ start:22 stop:609 length:588 start_codon:yes stop_codon:yes gene_type:complete
VRGKKHNYKVGSFETNAYRKRPTFERVTNFLDEMGSDMSDHDVYLWGSWPEKKSTWDVDLLLKTPGDLDYEQMENISKRALDVSLNQNQFLADVGYTNKEIIPFNNYKDIFLKTGRRRPHTGYVYGEKWMVDDKVYKDRSKFQNGVVIPKSNNILKINSVMPYPKMIKSLQNKTYDSLYANKPTLIKPRRKVYSI